MLSANTVEHLQKFSKISKNDHACGVALSPKRISCIYWGWFRFLDSCVLPKLEDEEASRRISKKLFAQLLPMYLYILKVYFIVVYHIINRCLLNIVLPLYQDITVLK